MIFKWSKCLYTFKWTNWEWDVQKPEPALPGSWSCSCRAPRKAAVKVLLKRSLPVPRWRNQEPGDGNLFFSNLKGRIEVSRAQLIRPMGFPIGPGGILGGLGSVGRLGEPKAEMEGAGDQFPIHRRAAPVVGWDLRGPGSISSQCQDRLKKSREPRMSTIQFLKSLPLLLSTDSVPGL